jgi:hypothetical protein
MPDYDAEAERLSDELDAWLQAHPRDKVTGADARLFLTMTRTFGRAAGHAVDELRRANQHYQGLAEQVKQAAFHNEELRRGRPLSFVERHFTKPAGAAIEPQLYAVVAVPQLVNSVGEVMHGPRKWQVRLGMNGQGPLVSTFDTFNEAYDEANRLMRESGVKFVGDAAFDPDDVINACAICGEEGPPHSAHHVPRYRKMTRSEAEEQRQRRAHFTGAPVGRAHPPAGASLTLPEAQEWERDWYRRNGES